MQTGTQVMQLDCQVPGTEQCLVTLPSGSRFRSIPDTEACTNDAATSFPNASGSSGWRSSKLKRQMKAVAGLAGPSS